MGDVIDITRALHDVETRAQRARELRDGGDIPTLEAITFAYVKAVMAIHNNNYLRASKVLGIDRGTLKRLVSKINLHEISLVDVDAIHAEVDAENAASAEAERQ